MPTWYENFIKDRKKITPIYAGVPYSAVSDIGTIAKNVGKRVLGGITGYDIPEEQLKTPAIVKDIGQNIKTGLVSVAESMGGKPTPKPAGPFSPPITSITSPAPTEASEDNMWILNTPSGQPLLTNKPEYLKREGYTVRKAYNLPESTISDEENIAMIQGRARDYSEYLRNRDVREKEERLYNIINKATRSPSRKNIAAANIAVEALKGLPDIAKETPLTYEQQLKLAETGKFRPIEEALKLVEAEHGDIKEEYLKGLASLYENRAGFTSEELAAAIENFQDVYNTMKNKLPKTKTVKQYSQEDIEHTAKKYGITVEKVKAKLGIS